MEQLRERGDGFVANKAKTTEVAGSHASLVVHAAEVAAVIEKAAITK